MTHARWKANRSAPGDAGEGLEELYEDARLADELAQKVYDRRVELGLSQTQLAERAGMKQPQVSRLEGGGTVPTLPLLRRLAKALEWDLHVGFTAADAAPTLGTAVADLVASAPAVGAPEQEAALMERLASLDAHSSRADVDEISAALVKLKVLGLAAREARTSDGSADCGPSTVRKALHRIRVLVDTAVDEAEAEVRRIDGA
ncbi:helix-turn-helix domain-containing protein [Streptomyces sp. NPDC127069]|uniref:helix-turn-helix domain-containing protein n=1 Tax=Streptomyces sp. NPDC127069 TaxID=3347128 RepID=UPI0036668539